MTLKRVSLVILMIALSVVIGVIASRVGMWADGLGVNRWGIIAIMVVTCYLLSFTVFVRAFLWVADQWKKEEEPR